MQLSVTCAVVSAQDVVDLINTSIIFTLSGTGLEDREVKWRVRGQSREKEGKVKCD